MDPLQSTYGTNQARWVKGMPLKMELSNRISRIAEGGTIGFGVVAVRGTADNQCKVAEVDGKPLGITILDRTQLQDSYPEYSMVTIMTKGVVVGEADVAVAQGEPVYFVPATGVLTNVATGNIAIPNAVWDTSTQAAGLAAIRLG